MSQLLSIQPVPKPGLSPITKLPILILNIHTLCNCRCVMCDIWQRTDGRQLAPATLDRHRESIIHLGVQHVVLTGGEPLLHQDLAAILSFFRDLGIRITVLTSGLLLAKRASLLADHVDEIILSLDGPAEIHNAIRRIPRAFQITAQGVAALRRLKQTLPIACRTTIQKQNHIHLRATVEAAHTLSLDSISFLPADLSSSAFNRDRPWHPDRQNQIALNASEVKALEEEVEHLIASYPTDLGTGFIRESAPKLRRLVTRFREHLDGSIASAPPCNAPWVSAVMEVDGDLRPCFFHAATASTAHATLEEAVNNPSAQAFRAQLDVSTNPICRRCVCSLNYKGNV